jgi:Ion transport protein
MFIYTLLGMEIFAERPGDTNDYYGTMKQVRLNFNNFFSGFIVVFTVLTGENWDDTMFQFTRRKGYISILFFVSLIIIGVMIFLNLFLAILLENFDDDEDEEDNDQSIAMIQSKLTECIRRLLAWLKKCLGVKDREIIVENDEGGMVEHTPFGGDQWLDGQQSLQLSLKRVP